MLCAAGDDRTQFFFSNWYFPVPTFLNTTHTKAHQNWLDTLTSNGAVMLTFLSAVDDRVQAISLVPPTFFGASAGEYFNADPQSDHMPVARTRPFCRLPRYPHSPPDTGPQHPPPDTSYFIISFRYLVTHAHNTLPQVLELKHFKVV